MDEITDEKCDEDAEEAELASLVSTFFFPVVDASETSDENGSDIRVFFCLIIVKESFASSQYTQFDWDDDQELGIVTLVELDSATGKPVPEDVVHSSTRGNRKRKKERININVTNASICKNIHNNNNNNNIDSNRRTDDDINVKPLVLKADISNLLCRRKESSLVDGLVSPVKDDDFVITDRDWILNTILYENDHVTHPVITSSESDGNSVNAVMRGPSSEGENIYGCDVTNKDTVTISDNSASEEPFIERSVYDTIDHTDQPNQPAHYINQDVREIITIEEPVKKRDYSIRPACEKRVSFHLDNIKTDEDENQTSTTTTHEDAEQYLGSELLQKLSISERGTPEGQEDPMTSSTLSLLNGSAVSPITKHDREQQSETTGKLVGIRGHHSPLFPSLTTVDKEVIKTSTEQMDAQIRLEVQSAKPSNQSYMQGEVPLDSNFHLLIMLEVVADQEEKVYKVIDSSERTIGY